MLARLAQEQEIILDRTEWMSTPTGFDEGFELLVVTTNGRQYRERFKETHLEDCATTSTVQQLLARQLRQLVLKIAAADGRQGR
jgi:hypothetical protein